MAASPTGPAVGGSVPWSTLPPELRHPIINITCIAAQGNPRESGSCARLASTKLNLVNREFEAIASPMQWQHLELTQLKDVAFFIVELLPKYAGTWRKFTLCWDERQSLVLAADGLPWVGRAAQALGIRTPRRLHSARLVLYWTLKLALSKATAVESLALHGEDWVHYEWDSNYPSSPVSCVRLLHLRWSSGITDDPNLGHLLHLFRHTLEDLRIELENERFRPPVRPGDFFDAWQADLQSEPALPRLRVLDAPERFIAVALPADRKISQCLEHINVVPDVRGDFHLAYIVEMYAGSLRTVVFTEGEWEEWGWPGVTLVLEESVQEVVDACERHGVAFRWILLLDHEQPGQAMQCPANLARLVTLI